MINAGVDLYTVGTVLGHKDARSTKRYSHLNAATLQRAVNAIGGQKSPHNGAHLGTKKGPPKAAQVIDLLRIFWRREAESNRPNRICNPGHNRFAIAPRFKGAG